MYDILELNKKLVSDLREIAKEFAEKFLDLNRRIWANYDSMYRFDVLSYIIKRGIELKILTKEDFMSQFTDDEKLIKLLKLEESSTEIFSTLDENGKLKIFETCEEIVEYFVNFRLTYYHKRKQHDLYLK